MANPAVANVATAFPALTGGILSAPLGTAVPVDASATVGVGFKALGYVGDGGLTNTSTRSTTPVSAWGGVQVAVLQTDYSETFGFSFIESLNPDVLTAMYSEANVTTTAANGTHGTLTAVKKNQLVVAHRAWVFEMINGLGKRRIVVPDGQLTLNGDITYTNGAIIAYPVTITCFPDASGNTSYEYTDNGVLSA